MEKELISKRTIKFLKFSIYIMTSLIIVGLILLFFGIKNNYEKISLKSSEVDIKIPKGYTIISFRNAENGNLWLHVITKDNLIKLIEFSSSGQKIKEINVLIDQ